MKYLHWRQLVGVAYTEEEAKALAFETEVGEGSQGGASRAWLACRFWGTWGEDVRLPISVQQRGGLVTMLLPLPPGVIPGGTPLALQPRRSHTTQNRPAG